MELIRENIYFVQENDSIKYICDKFKISEKQLSSLNNIENKKIEVGDILELPTSYNNIYIVKPKDNLNIIAEKFNVTIEHIKVTNKIGDDVFIGQQLYI